MTGRVAVVVVSYFSADDLEACLASLKGEELVGPVVIIDNASTDRSVAVARKAGGEQIEVVALDKNTGFAGGCNRGFAFIQDQAEYVAFMNPDVRVEKGCFEQSVEVMEANPRVGCVAPLLIRPDGVTVDSAGQLLERGTLEVQDRGYGGTLGSEWLDPCRVLAACGALAVFRREALESVMEEDGPWAEGFFCFWEDLELGWRLNNAGWEVSFEPMARAEHGRGAGAALGSGPLRWRRPPELEACIITNRWMTLVRHLHGLDLLWRAPVLLVWDLALVGAGVVRRPSLVGHLAKRWPLVWRELRERRRRSRKRLSDLPC
jgi:GT2 family glycosyltransferase